MTNKERSLQLIEETKIVAIVRTDTVEKALKIAEACFNGGIAALEVTFSVNGAEKAIEALVREYGSSMFSIGAGTVLDPETARVALLSGAQFIVSPYANFDVIKMCLRYQAACLPGAMTVKEIADCMEAGADIVKVFPGEVLGPGFIKAVKAPLPQARLMPTGGVSTDNAHLWLLAGAVALGVGGSLTEPAKTGDYAKVTSIAKNYCDIISTFKDGGKKHL